MVVAVVALSCVNRRSDRRCLPREVIAYGAGASNMPVCCDLTTSLRLCLIVLKPTHRQKQLTGHRSGIYHSVSYITTPSTPAGSSKKH